MLRRLLLLLLILSISPSLRGQCMTVPESLDNLVSASSLVVEGKVRSQQSYWDAARKNIYTVNEIEVFKVFQGLRSVGTIDVVTRGGVVGLDSENPGDLAMDRVSNALELQIGEMGMFLLQGFPIGLSLEGITSLTGTLYRPTEGVLGFIRYDLVVGQAQGIYESYSDIASDLYGQVAEITGLPTNIGLWDVEDAQLRGEPSVERSIVSEDASGSNSDFKVHAGVGDELTITGTDFGDEPGSVLFPDANSGGTRYIAALDHQILSWSAEQIVLQVPYRAGTGRIRIDKANGESLIGENDLPIGYDHINVQYSDASGRRAYETQLTSDNGSGGYNFQFEADFAANFGAAQAFTNLIETWACTTGVHFQIGEVTNVDEDANDGINIVRFDNGDELGGRTLAYARSRYRGCYQGDTIKWFVNEIEVVVNDDYDWYYGDGLPGRFQFDFETVMLHEIGHTQQLGHVINSNEVMHFAVGPGQQKRALSDIDTIGGIFVTDKSADEAVCGRELMERYDACCE
ncbi:MAG: matrixin family metalloprotease, partial [Pricia sp.]